MEWESYVARISVCENNQWNEIKTDKPLTYNVILLQVQEKIFDSGAFFTLLFTMVTKLTSHASTLKYLVFGVKMMGMCNDFNYISDQVTFCQYEPCGEDHMTY